MLVVMIELVEVARLHEEVRFLAERLPQLLDHVADIDELIGLDKTRDMPCERAHDVDVLRHDLLGAGTLHLDGNVLPRDETRAVHLRERGASERVGIDGIEQIAELLAVFRLEAVEHHRIRHRIDLGAQTTQLIAETLRQDLRAVGEDLAHLDEHGAQLLKQAAQLDRRDVVPDLILAHQCENLGDAPAATGEAQLILLGIGHDLRLIGHRIDRATATRRARRDLGYLRLVGGLLRLDVLALERVVHVLSFALCAICVRGS